MPSKQATRILDALNEPYRETLEWATAPQTQRRRGPTGTRHSEGVGPLK